MIFIDTQTGTWGDADNIVFVTDEAHSLADSDLNDRADSEICEYGNEHGTKPLVTITTLTVDAPDSASIVTSVHANEAEAIASLREHYDDEGEYANLTDAQYLASMTEEQSYVIYIDEHQPLSR